MKTVIPGETSDNAALAIRRFAVASTFALSAKLANRTSYSAKLGDALTAPPNVRRTFFCRVSAAKSRRAVASLTLSRLATSATGR